VEATNAESRLSTQVGNPMLGHIRDFIQTDEPAPVDPLGLVGRALRGRVKKISITLLATAAVFAVLAWSAIVPVFQSTAAVRVLPREAKLLYSEVDESRLRLYDAFVTAEVHLMQSRPILESAWQLMETTEDRGYAMPKDISELGSLITVSNRKGLVTVAARSSQPELSAATVNTVLDSYELNKGSARNRLNNVRRKELSERVATLTSTLQDLDERYLQIGGEHDLASLSKAHIAKTAQLEVIEERIGEVENTIARFSLTGSVGAADIRNVEIQRALLLDQALAEMTYERASRLAQLATLRHRYQPTHNKILTAELELATLEAAIEERNDQITTLGNVGALTGGTSQSSEQSLDELDSVREKLLGRRTSMSEEASELIGKLVKIRRIVAEQVRVSELLDDTKKALDEVVVESQAGLSRSIEIIARGKVPDRPIEDKRKPIAIGAALFGALGLLAMIVLASIFTPRVRFSDDLGAVTSKKILAVIPDRHISGADLQHASFKIRNEIDMRRTGESGPLVLGVAGIGADGRPEQLSIALAKAFVARDMKVLLIDADPNKAVTDELDLKTRPGLSNVIESELSVSKAINSVSTTHGDISVLSAGVTKDDVLWNQIANISIRDYRTLIDRAATDHEVIICALGVLSAGKHSALGASVSDQFVLLTSAGDRKRSITDAVTLLDRVAPERYFLAMNKASPLDPMLEGSEEKKPRPNKFFNRLALSGIK
jgi:uncharacterized protein involved in exopolysaccharide biosynthesis